MMILTTGSLYAASTVIGLPSQLSFFFISFSSDTARKERDDNELKRSRQLSGTQISSRLSKKLYIHFKA